ncbi:MAG: HEAT repeat domain-containing protein [Planctomycetaceae bacterium]
MARINPIDARLKRLTELANEPDSEAAHAELRRALHETSNLVVAKAAEIIGERELSDFTNELKSLWSPLCSEPERDRGCTAKNAILDALARLGLDDPDFCLAGMKYEQFDPGYPASDSAVNVRGGCAALLARSWKIGVNDKLIAMTELLADSERVARVHAVNAIADVGHECVIPLLRVKVQCGDKSVEVTGACFSALLRMRPEASIPFVAKYLRHSDEQLVCEAAAALGECGRPDAIQILIETWKRTDDSDLQESLLISLGLSRHSAAVDFLISVVASVTHASEYALRALAPNRFYSDIRQRIQTSVETTKNGRLRAIFNELFETK